MIKTLIFLAYILISLNPSKSATMKCDFEYHSWSSVGNLYSCFVTKGITINSLQTAFVNSTTGSHQSGHTNDNVNYFYTNFVTISYFPRGLDEIFKNLTGICLDNAGLKEIHQSDLKPFSKLRELLIHGGSQIEILEEGLFDFNPDLEFIYLYQNKITHIDPKVFDSLTKLNTLQIYPNACINNQATDRTSVLNLITEANTKCNNSDYSSLDQKLKFLKSESKSLNFNDFKLELENLESKVNVSKFVNFYQTKLQNLKTILDEKNRQTLNVEFLNSITKNDGKINNLSENILNVNKTVSKIVDQMSSLKESFLNFKKEASTEFKDNFAKNNENYAELSEEIVNVKKAVESIDKKIEELKASIKALSTEKVESESKATNDVMTEAIYKAVEKIEKNLMAKMDDNLKGINREVQECEKRFSERAAKILKALKVIFDVSDMALNYSLQ